MSLLELRDIIQLQSLAFTAPFLVLAFLVVVEAVPALVHGQRDTPLWWMTWGIILGFVGGFFDSLYWTLPWAADYLGSPLTQPLNENGVISNIVFRQGFGLVSAYCHIRAFIAPEKGGYNRNRLMRLVHHFVVTGIIFGQLFAATLYYIRTFA